MEVFSAREHLAKHGVTEEPAMRQHLELILQTEKITGKRLDLSRYMPTPGNPNQLPPMMG